MNRKQRIERIQRIAKIKEALEAREAQEAQEVQEQPQQEQGPGALEAAKMGAVQGATFHMADEISAGVDTVKHVIEDAAAHYNEVGMKGITDALPNLKETYNKNLDQERLLLEEARKKHPYAFTAGDIAGSVLSTAATFGTGKLLHAGRALTSARGALAANSAIAAAHGFGDSSEETIAGMLEDTVKAGAMGAAGDVVGSKLSSLVAPALKNLSTSTVMRYLKVNKGTAANSLKNFGKDVDDWCQRLINYTDSDGKKIINVFQKRSTMADRVATERTIQGNNMGAVLDEIDNNFNVDIKVDELYDDIIEKVFEGKHGLSNTLDVDQENMSQKLREKLYSVFYNKQKLDPKTKEVVNPRELRDNITMRNIHAWVSRAYKDAAKATKGRGADPAIEHFYSAKKEIADIMTEHVDTIINMSGDLKKSPLLSKYSNARQAYGDMKEAEKLLVKSLKDDPAEGFLNEIFTTEINKYLLAGSVMGTQGGLQGAKGMATVAALKTVANNRSFNAVLGKSANIIADAIKSDPKKFERIGARLLVSSSIGGKALLEDIMMSSAQIDLMKNPVARTTQEVIRRADAILTVIDGGNKQMAGKLRKAIQNGNEAEIAGIMSELSKEDPAGIIQKGLGWEGKAVTEEDKQQVQEYLKGISNTKKRMLQTTQFDKDQMIPQEMLNPQLDTEPVNKMVHKAAKRNFTKPKDSEY